jgi:hypothetical protein
LYLEKLEFLKYACMRRQIFYDTTVQPLIVKV